MSKDQILAYLKERRVILAPVYDIESRYNRKMSKRDQRSAIIEKVIGYTSAAGFFLIILGFMALLLGVPSIVLFSMGIAVIGFAVAMYIVLDKLFCGKLNDEMDAIAEEYSEITSTSLYRDAKQGFPSEFYNYRDMFKLWRLIDENRALTLQDAYHTLERQKVYEDQAAHNAMMAGYQRDIARYTKISAVSNTVTAINSQRIYKQVKY